MKKTLLTVIAFIILGTPLFMLGIHENNTAMESQPGSCVSDSCLDETVFAKTRITDTLDLDAFPVPPVLNLLTVSVTFVILTLYSGLRVSPWHNRQALFCSYLE